MGWKPIGAVTIHTSIWTEMFWVLSFEFEFELEFVRNDDHLIDIL